MKLLLDSPNKNIVGERVKEARIKICLSQQQLSDKLEVLAVYVCRGSISRIESGDRLVTDIELEGLTQVLHVSLDYLFRKTGT